MAGRKKKDSETERVVDAMHFSTVNEAMIAYSQCLDWPMILGKWADQRAAKLILENIPKWGDPGSWIRGSRLVRGYCCSCGQPLRLRPEIMLRNWREIKMFVTCTNCKCALHPGYNHSGYHLEDLGPWGENAVRALEDGG